VTVIEYVVPFVSPLTVIGLTVPEAVIAEPPAEGVAYTVYEVMALPPFEEGGANATCACPLPAVVDTFCGAPGGPGVTVTVTV